MADDKVDSRRKVFIGSSVEGLPAAQALRTILEHEKTLRPYVWSIVDFHLGQTTLASLQGFLKEYYYGIFVLTPDDRMKKRGKRLPSPRDNVLFEYGLFLGHSGGERTFIVKPRNVPMHLPSDLKGITSAEYEDSQDENELLNNLDVAAQKIKLAIRDHEDNQKKRARDRITHHVQNMRQAMEAAHDDAERVNLVLEGLRQLVQEKAEAMDQTVRDTLEDILLWTSSLMDVLDPDQLASAQAGDLREVWVYAPNPLELKKEHGRLRDTVLGNLLRGVRYTYFVDSKEGVTRIKQLIEDMLAQAGTVSKARKEKARKRAAIVQLEPSNFLTYYTVHKGTNGRIVVFQSVIKKNRLDILTKLDDSQAAHVVSCIEKLMEKTKANMERQHTGPSA